MPHKASNEKIFAYLAEIAERNDGQITIRDSHRDVSIHLKVLDERTVSRKLMSGRSAGHYWMTSESPVDET